MQLRPACRQFLNQFAHLGGPVRHRSQVADFTAPFAMRNRHRDRRLVDIQPDKRDILHVVSPLFLRLGARQPGATLERRMPRERPTTQSVHTTNMGSKGSRQLQTMIPDLRPIIHACARLRALSFIQIDRIYILIPDSFLPVSAAMCLLVRPRPAH
jgi:hypothetical protein